MVQGWECPKCGRVYAPHVDRCKYCIKDITTPKKNIEYPREIWCKCNTPLFDTTSATQCSRCNMRVYNTW